VVNQVDQRKTSPIMLAAHSGYVDAVSALVDAGGDPDLMDMQNKSAIDYAKMGLQARKVHREIGEVQLSRLQMVLQTRERSNTGSEASHGASGRQSTYSVRQSAWSVRQSTMRSDSTASAWSGRQSTARSYSTDRR
jgi:hypothetical protein